MNSSWASWARELYFHPLIHAGAHHFTQFFFLKKDAALPKEKKEQL